MGTGSSGIPSEAFDKSDAEKAISLAEEFLKFVEKKATNFLTNIFFL